ncbi:hypothetical protein ME0901_08960 [Lactobacillus delbrueckii subsp. bulgaricus]|uniref:Sugar ABC transporter permease n=1 Tax=Lactobacillus delbrueckii subsp. bulgaricus TaxID=1585 RepID=A0AAV5PD98_LACDE|nr:hypothetical protein ME0899_06230 [Lactobacillus delbrueckii subsp. bulgaricus]GMB86352.1 hypothetical protein ME0900_07250 [Lactobacillus delbrueckii subsp. bulgaricus]GMB88374.1 hypothetical protein ME0901_08960 [Lactobacillus delbrueckii subsp. bulgaricus]
MLTILAILWLIPILWIVLASFSYNDTGFISTFFPEKWTFQNYIGIFTNSQFPYLHWIINTLLVAIISATLSTFFQISVAYVLSRLRFRLRKPFLQIALVLGMFPWFYVYDRPLLHLEGAEYAEPGRLDPGLRRWCRPWLLRCQGFLRHYPAVTG